VGDDLAAAFPQIDAHSNQQLNLLWIACGTEDRLLEPNRKVIAWLKTKEIKLTPVETPGMHTWMVWRRNLIAFAPLLFQRSSGTASTSNEK
jgi:enterochelin esterase family protein